MPLDELGDGALLDQATLADDHEVVGHELHLRQQVAADEHGASIAGEEAEYVTHPLDALRIEPVAGLVEHHGVRVTEEHTGEAQPLTHAQRVAANLLLGDLRHADHLQHVVDAAHVQPVAGRQPAQVIAATATRVHVPCVEERGDLRERPGDLREPTTGETGVSGLRAGRARACSASWCSSPSRWDRGNR